MTDLAEELIASEEGHARSAYLDSRGFWTIGIGCCVDARVKGTGLCDAAIDAQFEHDRSNANSVCARIPNFGGLDEVRQAALVSIAFQLGDQILGWHGFMTAMAGNDRKAAAAALLESEWARIETPHRAERECSMLETGLWMEKLG